ncbi:MAG: S1C family serine protease, partial [Acidimicrobiales bacterium]
MNLDDGEFEEDGAAPGGRRGWIHPDDRLWRHPSEASTTGSSRENIWARHRRLGDDLGGPTGRVRVPTRPRQAWSRPAVLVVVVVAAAGVLVGTQVPLFNQPSSSHAALTGGQAAYSTTIPLAQASPSVMTIAAEVASAMVAVSAVTPTGENRGYGLVYRTGGLVLILDQLVKGATSLNITTSGGLSFPANVVAQDPDTGLAVLKIDGSHIAPAPMSGATLSPGQLAFAVNFSRWPTTDTSLAIGTVIASGQPQFSQDGYMVPDAIETDCPQRPAQPYGVIIDQSGRVIGLESGISQAGSHSMMLATPISRAVQVGNELVTSGHVAHGWLGVLGAPGSDLGPGSGPVSSNATGTTVVTSSSSPS